MSGTGPITVATGSTTPVISLAQASGSANGYLSYGDWNAFNSKQDALGYVPLNKSGDTMSGALSVPLLTQAGTAAPSVAGAGQGSIYFDPGSNQFKVSQNGSAYAPLVSAASVTRVEAGTGLSGGPITTAGTISLSNTGVTAGSYTRANMTVDQQGRLIAAASSPAIVDADISGTAAIAQSKISGLVSALTSKEPSIEAGTVAQYWRGDKSWKTLDTTTVPEGSNQYFTVARAVASLTGSAPISYSTTTGNIAISKASGSIDGYLSASDWGTFNNKQDALGFAPLNKAGDTMSGALNMNGQPLAAVGNVVLSAAKTLGLGVFDDTAEPLMTAQLNSSGASSPDKGKTWFNSSTNQIKYWEGSSAQALGVSGSGLSSFNGQTGNTQTLVVPGTSGTAPAWSSASNAHTLNIPLASTASVIAGLISNSDYSSFSGKVAGVTSGTGVTVSTTGNIATINLATAGTAGSYSKVTTDAYGRVTSGTSLSAADIPPLSAAIITSGTLTVANGGTGTTTLATNSVILGNGTSAVQTVAPGTGGNVLTSNGTMWQSTALPASVTNVSGTAPISVATGTSTPVISMSQANGSTNGYLSSADWTAFNSKQSSGSYIGALTGDVTADGPGSAAATLAAVAVPGTSTKVTYDVKGRVTSGTSLSAADIPPLSAAVITSGTLSASNGGTGIGSTAAFPSTGVIVTEEAAETLTNKTLTGATINGASNIVGSTSINTSGAITSGALTAATIVSQGSVTIQGDGTNASKLVLNDKGTNYLALKSPDTLAASTTWVLPSADGAGGQVLATNGSGTLGWASGLAPTGVAGGDLGGSFPNPTVSNVGGVTAANVANGANLANAATNANTASTIVKRDASGNFAAGTITANLTGTVTGTLNGNASTATSAGSFTGSLAGDVTGTQGATVVANVGGVTAVNVAAGAGLANAATSVNTGSTIVKRDASGNFAAGTVTGNLTGNVTGNVSGTAANVTGTVAVANGGTGATTLAANNVLLGNGTSSPLTVAPGSSGNVLMSNGTTWASSTPTTNWASPGAIGATTANTAAFTTLTVSGNVGIGTTVSAAHLSFGNSSGGQAAVHLWDGGVGSRVGMGINTNETQFFTTSAAHFSFNKGGDLQSIGTNELMRIGSDGNVGIGTTSPGGALQVNGTTILGGALSTSGGDFSFMDAGVADSTAVRLMSNGGNLFLQNGSGGNTYFRNKTAATVMTVQNGGNVGIGTTSPAAALEVNGGFIRAIAHASGTGAQSNTAPAQIAGRTLTFTKSKSSTSIRIGWTDGVRVGFGTDNTACRYEIKVDGSSCSGGAMVYEFYMGGAAYIDHHRPQTLVGYCDGLGVGSHTLTLWVGPVPGWTQGSCYTGWNSVRWVLEAEEVN